MIACVVFDFDGVLVDSNAMKRRAYFDIFAPLGPTASIVQGVLASTRDGDRYQVIGRILRELTTTGLLPDVGEQERLLQDYAGRYNAICEDFAATCCEISGASTSLERLAGRYALYINSATPEEPLRRIVARRGWERWFRDVLGRPRTKAENLRRAFAREGIGGAATVFVGDNQRDLDAAIECGCRFVGVRGPFNDFDPCPTPMIDDLHRLEEAIGRMEARGE